MDPVDAFTGQGAPLRALRVRVEAVRGTGAYLTGTLLEQYGAAVSHGPDHRCGGAVDVVLFDDEAVMRAGKAGLDLHDDGAWGAGMIRCAVTVAGVSEVGSYPADELVAQALSGMVDCTGYDETSSVAIGVPIATVSAAFLASCAISALVIHREAGGADLIADVSLRDCCFAVLASTHLPVVLAGRGRPPRVGNRHPAFVPWNTYRAADQWIQICGGRNWSDLCELIGMPEWRDDPDFTDVIKRIARSDELDSAIGGWCANRTSEDAVRELTARDIPSAVVHPPPNVALCDLAAPQRFDLVPGRPAEQTSTRQPLAGVLVVEMGLHTAGPLATRVLASLGATVVKVEPPRGDPARGSATKMPGGDGYLYELNNVDKQSVVADLATDAGRDLVQRVLDEAAVFVQNLAPGYIDRIGVDIDSSRLLRCDISGFDPLGPRARDKAFDAVLQALTGVMTLTGSEDAPLKPGGSLTDQLTAFGMASAITATYAGAPSATGRIEATLEHATRWLVAARLEPGLMPGLRPAIVNAADGEVAVRLDTAEDQELLSRLISRTSSTGRLLSRAELAERCAEEGLVAAPVLGLDEVVDDAIKRGGLFTDVSDERRRARVMEVPLGLPRGLTSTVRPAPSLGQHTASWADNDRKVTRP
jgi:crotonobetainyl-CoA:carnitine CoA-transferase CaiB-like acyl-CoA transferase